MRPAGRNAGEPRGGDMIGNECSCTLRTPGRLFLACLRMGPGPGNGTEGARLRSTSMGEGGREGSGPRRPKNPGGDAGELRFARLGRREASYGAIRVRRCGDGFSIVLTSRARSLGRAAGLPTIVGGTDASDLWEVKDVFVETIGAVVDVEVAKYGCGGCSMFRFESL
jgi:hypothetical protein